MDAKEPNQVDVPQSQPVSTDPDGLDAVRLEVRIEELERRLRARSRELETELKAKERLRERVRELTQRIDELQETASALHREAVSSTSLARELDETLKVAAEARLQLGAALEGERSLRAEAAARAEAELAQVRQEANELLAKAEKEKDAAGKHEEELNAVRRQVSQLRQKTAGHEAHIESLRAELEQMRNARDEAAAATQAALEQARANEEKMRQAVENAERIRREGVESAEQAREEFIRKEVEIEHKRADLAEGMRRLCGETEALKTKADRLKVELRERADNEIAEMRRALDEERARLYADIEAEREARGRLVSAPSGVEAEKAQQLREEGAARRLEITREVESYIEPKATEPASQPPAAVEAAAAIEQPSSVSTVPPAPAPAFQWDEEMRLLFWVAIGMFLVAAIVGGVALYQG